VRAALRRRAPDLLVAALAAAVFSWHVATPSPWRDEGATLLAAGRDLPGMLDLTRHVDLVHLPYYLLAHVALEFDRSIVVLRGGSVAAMAATAGLLVAVGRRLGSTTVGVVAGLALITSPLASRYAAEARPYALATLAATGAAWALAGAVRPGGPSGPGGRRAWAGYALTVVGCGLANVLALFVLAGHLAFVLALHRRSFRRWAIATSSALLLLAPFLVATSRQAAQVGWLHRPAGSDLLTALGAGWNGLLVPAVLLLVAVLVAVRTPTSRGRAAVVLGAGWGLLPAVVLWLVSQVHPLFDGRYLVAALPGTALAIASPAVLLARERVRRRVSAVLGVGVLALAVVGWPAQLRYRDAASGHAEDVRGAADVLAAHARAGDAVLYVPSYLRIIAAMYPQRTALVADLARSGVTGAVADPGGPNLVAPDVAAPDLAERLRGRDRVWLVTDPASLPPKTAGDATKLTELTAGYRETGRWQVPYFTLTLFTRNPHS
jgi:mannosyltransferase